MKNDPETRKIIDRLANSSSKDKARWQERLDRKLSSGTLERLTDGKGMIHPTAILLREFTVGDPVVKELLHALSTPIKEVSNWMCAPIFRDAIAFYGKDNSISSILNICFECKYIQDERGVYIDVDNSVYRKLKGILESFDHSFGV